MLLNNDANDASCVAQQTIGWHRARIGHITSSMVYNVMLEPTKKDAAAGEIFSGTCKSYLYRLAAERNLKDRYINDDLLLQEYLERVNVHTKAMRYGTETEALAREVYARTRNVEVVTAGFIAADDKMKIDNYGDSPDGIVLDKDGRPMAALEIKCPNPDTFIKYRSEFNRGKSLKEVEEKYYWQCQSHCAVNRLPYCDFVVFDKMQKKGLVVVRIDACEPDIDRMIERVRLANDYINSLIIQ